MLPDGGGWTIFKVVVSVLAAVDGLLLAGDMRTRRAASDRLQAATGRTHRAYGWVVRPFLQVFGVVALAFGVLELVRVVADAI